MNRLVEQLVVEILRKQLNLDENRVIIGLLNKKAPRDDKMYITVSSVSDMVYGSTNKIIEKVKIEDGTIQYFERQETSNEELVQIDVMSYSKDALLRHKEVVTAVNSVYSKQLQEKYNFTLAKVFNAINASHLEGSGKLTRIVYTLKALTFFRKDIELNPSDSFNEFTIGVDNAETIETDKRLIELKFSGEET
ncbi:MAG: hypothetical protein R3D71_05970 [Rickettsiales bacterium]